MTSVAVISMAVQWNIKLFNLLSLGEDIHFSLGLELEQALPEGAFLSTTFVLNSVEFVRALVQAQEVSSYPICVDNSKDPVTINCGHSFCCSCISMTWKDLGDTFPCPVCHFWFGDKNIRSKPSSVIWLKLLIYSRSEGARGRGRKRVLCVRSTISFWPFLGKDLEVLCTQCSFFIQQWKHYICPIKKAASHHKKILQCTVEPLKSDMEQVEKVITLQASQSVEREKPG